MGVPSDDASSEPVPGDPLSRALDDVLARFTEAVRQLARRFGLGSDDVDDLLQEVRIRLWRALRTPERIREVRALYVHRTVASAALDLIRRRRAHREHSLDAVAQANEAPELVAPVGADRDADRAEFDAVVARAIDGLMESRRAVVRLYLAGHTREEIADMLGWSEPKTRNLLYRGLGELSGHYNSTPTTAAR